jgi:hypothetical protein
MPRRGYRKGVSDSKEPVTRSIRTHITDAEFTRLSEHARSRSMTLSKFLRALVAAHLRNQPVALPHPRGLTGELVREFCRLGNNLNQIAHKSNLMHLPLIEQEARQLIATINAKVRSLS